MQFLKLRVRQSWSTIGQQTTAENTRLWREVQGAVVLSTAVIFLLSYLKFPWPWENVFRTMLSSALFVGIALGPLIRSLDRANRGRILLFGLLGGFSVLGWYLYPTNSLVQDKMIFPWVMLLILIIPLTSWFLLLRSKNKYPRQMWRLGLVFDEWPLKLIIGISLGGALAFHLLLLSLYLPEIKIHPFTWYSGLWAFSFQAGLIALGEELLFRGLGFSLLYEGFRESFWKAAGQIVFLNLLVYLVFVLQGPNLMAGILLVGYRTVLLLVNTFLRYHQRSLIPCLASNIVFSVVFGTML